MPVARSPGPTLTARELLILRSIGEQGDSQLAARQLGISYRALRQSLRAIYSKLGLNTSGRLQAAQAIWQVFVDKEGT